MEPDDGLEDEGPFFAWLPPDDRLWRHPSEVPGGGSEAGASADPSHGRRGALPGLLSAGASGPARQLWSVAIIAGLIGALAASGLGMVSGVFEQQTTVIHATMPDNPAVSLASDDTGAAVKAASTVDWTSVDNTISPSVVAIAAYSASNASAALQGSGLLLMTIHRRAYVITDSALVAGGGTIQVTFMSGPPVQAQIVGTDAVSGLGLLSVPETHQIFPPFGSVAALRFANPVLAVGARTFPGGAEFQGSISAEDQEVDQVAGPVMQNLIEMSGSSVTSPAAGGPLVNGLGQVVGITVDVDPVDDLQQGLTFAVPIDIALHVAQQLLDRQAVTHPYLGVINTVDITSALAHQYGLPGGAQVGFDGIVPDSPASRLGLDPTDIITSFNGDPVTSSGSLTQLLFQVEPGDQVVISFLHKGKPQQASLLVRNQPTGQ